MYELRDKYAISLVGEYELVNYYEEHQEIISEYQEWEGHDYNPWYLEYLKFHKKLIGSIYQNMPTEKLSLTNMDLVKV